MLTVRYTEWDGSQRVRLAPRRLFERFAEYLSYTDDVDQALDWLLRHGLDLDDARVAGLDELLESVRDELEKLYQSYNVDHALDEIRDKLEELLDLERDTLDQLGESGQAKREQLDRLPHSVSEALEQLRDYDFEDEQARGELENLLEELERIRDVEGFQRRFGELFQGPESLDFSATLSLMEEMERLKGLEEQLLSGSLDGVSLEDLEQAIGPSAARDLEALRQVASMLRDAGYLRDRAGRAELSPKGVRQIGQLALREIYQGLLRDRAGGHASDHRGIRDARPDVTRPYTYGDPLNLDLVRTLKKSLGRRSGAPLDVRPDDFEIYDTQHATTTSTVLLLDMSWSMSWEGRFAAAKKVALAMESLIRSRYPRDYFGIVGFYTHATELKVRDLPEATWNMGDPFTNLQDGLRLGGELLRRHPSSNQYVIVITDGQPTAYYSRGRLYCEWPLSFGGISVRAAQETLREAERITRRGVTINTFMLDDSPSLRAFVEKMTRINKGRALFTRPDRLGKYLLVDYIQRKRKRV